METFTSASHHDILVLILQISVLLFTARALGELAQRWGQPSVVGEILAGIVLGPSFLSSLFPFIKHWIIPQTPVQGYLLEVIGLIGVMLLLLITGLETDVILIRRQAKYAISASLGGLSVTLVAGFCLGYLIPDALLVDPEKRFIFALFMAVALAISAIPVIAKVLMDLNLTRRDVGQTIIAAAMIDDTVGWIILSIIIGIASEGVVSATIVLESIGKVVVFMGLSFTLGIWLVKHLVSFVRREVKSRDKMLSLVIILAFLWGTIAQGLHLEAMLGAFVMGIMLSQLPNLDSDVIHKLESLALAIFAPIFFSIAGLKVNILELFKPDLILVLFGTLAVAMLCKFTGVYVGARYGGGSSHWRAVFYGFGLNARGSMGIIIASIGLSFDLVNQNMFSIIVVMAIVTSLAAPPLLKWALLHIQIDAEEQDRLRREAVNKDNPLASLHRILLPVRARSGYASRLTQVVEAKVIERLNSKGNMGLTLMTVANTEQNECGDFLTEVGQRFSTIPNIRQRVAVSNDHINAILDEVGKGYDLLILGASERSASTGTLFSRTVDELVRLAPTPTIVVHAPQKIDNWQLNRIVVGTSGSLASRRAAQLAFALSRNHPTEVTVLKVIESTNRYGIFTTTNMEQRDFMVAHQIVDELAQLGQLLDINIDKEVEVGSPENKIVAVAKRKHADLLIIGTSVRPGSESLYLGPKVERILEKATCPVLIFNV